ncbi:MAG: mechanosensitive ion channel protein MscS [Betaproteobacteria bacterium]|nr:MAG: mechanosensitive ion channel protein MscS [Betaproteobacteria bacterium]
MSPSFMHLSSGDILTQVAILLLLIATSLWLSGRIKQRVDSKQLKLGVEIRIPTLNKRDFLRLFTPPLASLLTLIASLALANWTDTSLLKLAQPLLLSLAAVQFFFYVLRRIFKPSALLSSLEHSVAWLIWGIVALHLTGHLPALVATLDSWGVTVGKNRISLYTTLLGLMTLGITLLSALWAARSIEARFIDRSKLQTNLKFALAKILRTLLLVVAILVALPVIGIDITVLSVFGGALGVGLGLGLQKIAANYVSGFTLLLDQSIRIGDMVTVGQHYGEVKQIATRYTIIQAADGSESIIPNDSMITSTVINHTLASRDSRVALPIQVAYDTDINLARTLLLAAAQQDRVTRQPAPQVLIKGFGENGIDLELGFWIPDPEEGLGPLKSTIYWAIWEAFKREGIVIPYPQRVVNLRQEQAKTV